MVLLAHRLILLDEQLDIFWSGAAAQSGDMMSKLDRESSCLKKRSTHRHRRYGVLRRKK
jgi:hypothetical protein